ncbi:MAG: RDD family protein [Bacteroidales bacterium]|jgi:uncharacterized RDD family membrane protein YckC|nr:RDD family protein [Bacteroidales bacterium]
MSYIEIQTTQNIRLEYETASIGERFAAAVLDRLILYFWLMIWFLLIGTNHIGFSIWLTIIIYAPYLFYFLLCELLLNGQSPGKRIMSVRVAKIDGTVPSFGDYFLRWVFRLVDNAAVAIVCMMFTIRCQRLGDLAAKTCVVRTKSSTKLVKVPEVSPDYLVTYDTATLLSDRDAALIAQIISNPATLRNKVGLKKLANKVKTITRTSSNAHDYMYLRRILEDYQYLSGKLP